MLQKYNSVKYSSILAPVIPIKLGSPVTTKKNLRTFRALIDTGYDGSVLISQRLFEELGLMAFKIPDDLSGTAEFITGEQIAIKSAEGILYVEELDLELAINVDAVDEIHEILLGRQCLEELYLALRGPEKDLVIALSNRDLIKSL
ncbi:MAG: hypothetical protein ACFFGZ_12290 [Candidatus Thorarchaeota archaeon]